MTETNPRGRFVWHELMTSDPEAAMKFYPSVLGWGVMPFEQDPSYNMWTAGGAPHGGVMALGDQAKAMGQPPHWLPYIGTLNIDATIEHAARLGATTLVPAKEIMVGKYAVLSDPQGAVFALFQAADQPPGHEGIAEIGEFSWHELRTADWSAAFDFYRELFGWNATTAMDMGPDGKYQMFGRNGIELGGIYNAPARVQGPPAWLSYVRVESTDKSIAAAKRGGASVTNGPMEVPGGNYIAELLDPHGVRFAVHEEREMVSATGPAAKPKAKTKQKANAKAKPKAKAKATAKLKAKAKPNAKAKAKPKAKARAKPKAKTKTKPKAKLVAKAKSKSKPKAKAKPKKKASATKKRPARRHR